jgi:hypothetical protein
MSQILDSIKFQSVTANAPIAIEHSGQSQGLFTRYLTLHDKRAYELSFSCGTCYFLFERLDGANSTVSVKELDKVLQEGITTIEGALLEHLAPIIPAGRYVVNLVDIVPQLVTPSATNDYFSREQVALWGIDPFWGLPHYPKTEYYRSLIQTIGDEKALFEFVVPMVPKNWLKKDTWTWFAERITTGAKPTALAITVLDVKQPANWEGNPLINEHWCLAHFLLDGHHKMYAASQTNKPITLLSFLAVDECIANEGEVEKALQLLSLPS